MQISQVDNSRFIRIKNVKFSSYDFQMENVQICISVPLKKEKWDHSKLKITSSLHF